MSVPFCLEGHPVRKVFLFAGLVALAGLSALAVKDSKPATLDAIKRWSDGPVRYLMTSREYDEVLALDTTPDLARYITSFWRRRDPTPGTLENEYRRVYWGRVLEANRRFRDSTTPGWKTDRGKVFIVLGEPDDVESDDGPGMAATGSADSQMDFGQRGLERWTYRRRRSLNASPELVVAFVRDSSLDWKLSSNPDLIQPSFPGSSSLDAGNPSFGGLENASARKANQNSSPGDAANENLNPDDPGNAQGADARDPNVPGQSGLRAGRLTSLGDLNAAADLPAIDTSLFANYDLGLEMSVPTAPEAVIATVSTREFLAGFSALPRFEYFRAKDGATFVNLGLLIPVKELYGSATTGISNLRFYASLIPTHGSKEPLYQTNEAQPTRFDLTQGAAPGGSIEVWAGLALPPGRYQTMLAAEDSLTGKLGRATAEIDVPDLSHPKLSISTLVLASSLSDEGGQLAVTARRSSGVFKKSESLGIYYEVYGVSSSPPRFDVSYRFYRDQPGGPMPIGKPIVFADRTEAAQGWSIPLSKWPAGQFRLDVTVTDSAGPSQTASVSFEVAD